MTIFDVNQKTKESQGFERNEFKTRILIIVCQSNGIMIWNDGKEYFCKHFFQKLIELLLNIDFKSITFVVELWNAVATSFIKQFRFSPIFYACTLQKSAQFRNINKMLKIKYHASFLTFGKLSKWKVKIGKYPLTQ